MTAIRICCVATFLVLLSCVPKTAAELTKKAERNYLSWDKKEELYSQVLELDSNSIKAHYWLGWHYANAEDDKILNKSRSHFSRCLALDSTNAYHWYGMGYTYVHKGVGVDFQNTPQAAKSRETAIYYITKAIAIDSTESVFYISRASCYGVNGLDALQNSDYKKACQLGNSVGCMLQRRED